METNDDLKKIYEKIGLLKKTAVELRDMGKGFPAIERNTLRIMAGIKMMELNVSDILDAEK